MRLYEQIQEAKPFTAWEKDTPICLKCGQDLPEGFIAACGLKNPCPHCKHMYPLGDCSD